MSSTVRETTKNGSSCPFLPTFTGRAIDLKDFLRLQPLSQGRDRSRKGVLTLPTGTRPWLLRQVQRAMERILYIWAIRHPASGYVQGINDLMTPLYVVFLSTHVGKQSGVGGWGRTATLKETDGKIWVADRG